MKHPSSQRGSLLILAMLLSGVIALSIASYVQLGRTAMRTSNGALYNNAAMNLAENGLEEALYAINKTKADPTYSWSANGWDTASPVPAGDARRRLPASGNYTFDQGVTGFVRVYVLGYAGNQPRAIARATVTLPEGKTVEKWVEVRLRRASQFSNGLVAKNSIRFSGSNASVDSWHSKKNNDGTLRASPVPYSAAVAHDKGSVGSISVAVDAVLVQNADIWGYASTGGALPAVGSNGLVGPYGTPSGTMDMTRVATDFTANFENAEAPTKTSYAIASITTSTVLPRATDVADADGNYYYTTSRIDFNNETLTVQKKTLLSPPAKVVITLTDPTTSISIGGGSGAISIQSGSQLRIYAPGDIAIAGNGIANGGTTAATANLPETFQIWGTKTSGVQNISVKGNGALSGVIYAPFGSVTINGNGDICGSVVANNITMTGNAAFHFDESLADFGGNNPYRISLWREITAATDRNAITVLSW